MKNKRLISFLLFIESLFILLLPLNVFASNGTLSDFISYDGITGKLWIPNKITSDTGFIWCMPGMGGYTKGVFSAYDYVEQGLEHPKHVVFFVEYLNGSGSEVKANKDKIPDIINNIKKDYNLDNMGDKIFYYGFSKGSYLFGDGISDLSIWNEAILNDGGRANSISVGNLKRVVVIQGAENNINEYDKVFENTDVEYYRENLYGSVSAIHPKVNAWGATNCKYVYMLSSYYDKKLGDPKYGLNWFGSDNSVETTMLNRNFIDLNKLYRSIKKRY